MHNYQADQYDSMPETRVVPDLRRSLSKSRGAINSRWLISLSCLLLLWSAVVSVSAAEAEAEADAKAVSKKRPRIGLVLGGGGARGAAHVGVLKVLEELRIPVDYIAGTSMGSIVGGLYASGMNAEQIEQTMDTIDWKTLFDDDPARAERSFRRKRDDDLYTFKASIGVHDGKLEIPLAYIRGQKLDLELSKLTTPVYSITDFDQLPIPFRAVATDIETGKEVVLRDGNLAYSIRASMAVPAVFDPVVIDNRLLVDGGISNNVPVSVARDMGADVFIVVDVSSGLDTRDEITTALDVTGQLANFLFTLNTEKQLATLGPEDVLMHPALGDMSSGDFVHVAQAIPIGEKAAREMTESLSRYSVSAEEYAQYIADRQQRQTGSPVIDNILIRNQSSINSKVIADRITLKMGQPLDVKQLDQDISKIYGLEIFESVRYQLVRDGDKTNLLIDARQKSWGPGYLQFGLTSSNDLKGDAATRLGVVYTLTEINELNGEWRTGVQLGDEPGAYTELYQPLDPRSLYFVDAKVGAERWNVNIYDDDGNRISRYRLSAAKIDLSFGRDFGTWGEGRVGYLRESGSAEVNIGEPAPAIDLNDGQVYFRLALDRLDNLYFPTSGQSGVLQYAMSRESYGSSSDYDQWTFGFNQAFSWGSNTIVGSALGGFTENGDAPLEGLYQLGGFLRLSGLQNNQLAGQYAAMTGLVYMRRLSDIKFFKTYAGGSAEIGNVWQQSQDIRLDNTIKAGSLFVAFDTPVGPVYIGYGHSSNSYDSAYVYFGPRFTF
jgi:NTE family protein